MDTRAGGDGPDPNHAKASGGTPGVKRYDTGPAQVVGQLRMELFSLGAEEDLEQACRHHTLNAARNLVDSSVMLTDRLRAGRLQVEAAYYNLHTTQIEWMGSVMAMPRP